MGRELTGWGHGLGGGGCITPQFNGTKARLGQG